MMHQQERITTSKLFGAMPLWVVQTLMFAQPRCAVCVSKVHAILLSFRPTTFKYPLCLHDLCIVWVDLCHYYTDR